MKDRNQIIVRTSIIGIITNLLLVVLKGIVGFLANSVSIIMDAINNLSDSLSSVITIIGTKLSQRKPDADHPFGHGRIEYITSLIIATIILVAGSAVIFESVMVIKNEDKPTFNYVSAILIGVAVCVKIALGLYFRYMGKKTNSQALKGSGVDALFDALLSLGTLISVIVYLATEFSIEGYVGIIIGLFMIRSGFIILKDSLSSIIGERIDKATAEAIKKLVCSFKEVKGAYDLIVNYYGPDRGIGSIHIEVDDHMTAKEIQPLTRKIATDVFVDFGIIMTVGIYASNTSDDDALKIRNQIQKEVLEFPNVKQLHGFYLDHEKKLISFDIIVDFKDKNSSETVKSIREKVQEEFPDYHVVVVEDKDFSD